MDLLQILPELRKLNRAQKLFIMQFLISELAQAENEQIQPNTSYPIWSPYDSHDAAATMLNALRESKEEDNRPQNSHPRNPLKGSVLEYNRPFEPVAQDDWTQ